jgi:hypothetical protein
MQMPNATAPATFFEMWQDVMQHSSTFWWQTATAPQPADAAQQWRQWLTLWVDSWSKTCAPVPPPDLFQTAQKHCSEQLEALAQVLANVMGTEAFAAMQSKCFEQQLAWQDKFMKAAHPHIDMALRACNLPSREQIDRLFERVIGLEDRFDSVEADLRQLLSRVQEQSAPPVTDT